MSSASVALLIPTIVYSVLYWTTSIDCVPIIGGNVVPETEMCRYSYIVSLQDQLETINGSLIRKHFCGGSLIHPSWILTAAHCVYFKNESEIVAAIGYDDLESENVIHHDIVSIKVNNFLPSSLRNDIALVRLQEPITVEDDMDLGLISKTQKLPDAKCKVVGYGATEYDGPTQHKLREAEVEVISEERCTDILGKIMAPQEGDRAICAMGDSQDSCQGDSGGPLLCPEDGKFSIFGIVSHGITCGQPGVPSVYTLTAPYRNWINRVISETE